LLLTLIALACTGKGTDDTAGGDTAGTASFSVDITVDAVAVDSGPTIATVTWTTDAASVDAATVNVTTAAGESWTEDASAGSATLWGFLPEDEVTVTVSVASGGETGTSDASSFTAAPALSDLPGLEVTGDPEGALEGGLLLTTNIQSPGGTVVIDADGNYRWWGLLPIDEQAGRGRLSVDGDSVLMMPVNNASDSTQGIVRVGLDGQLIEQYQMDGLHHDFVEHSDGTIGAIVKESQPVDGHAIHGDNIVEFNPDGTTTEVWSSWDTLTYHGPDDRNPDPNEWTHANAIVFDEAEQVYYLSMLSLRAIAKIDRATGDVLWLIGSQDSDYVNEDGSTEIFEIAHQFQWLDDGSLLHFENGESGSDTSRVVQLSFDETEPVIRELWDYQPGLYVYAMGDTQRLSDGTTMVDLSTSGQIMQIDDAGTTLWQLNADIGGAFGYMSILHGVAGH